MRLRPWVVFLALVPSLALFAQKQPKVSVAGIRVVAYGLGANGSELHIFNEQPGTTIGLGIIAPEGSGIVDIDDHASRIDALTDDKGKSLLEEGRIGPFPKISEDRGAAIIEIETRGRPSIGASSLNLSGSVAMMLANGTKKTRIPSLKLEQGKSMKVGTATISVKSATAGEDSTDVTLALPRSTMNSIHTIRFFDTKGEAIDSHRTSSGYMNESAEMEFDVKTKDKTVAVEFELWQNTKQVKVPFKLTAGIGIAGGESAPSPSSSSSAETAPPPPARPVSTTPPVIGAGDGAASPDAALAQMRSGFGSGKGRDVLAVIYPDDRGTFAQGMAMIITFSVLGNMDDPKAAEKAQKEIDAIFNKHKIKPPLNRPPAEVFKNTDLAAFISDTVSYLKTHVPKGQDASEILPIPKGKLQNLHTEGDSAVAKVEDKDIKFSRVSNKWFLRIE